MFVYPLVYRRIICFFFFYFTKNTQQFHLYFGWNHSMFYLKKKRKTKTNMGKFQYVHTTALLELLNFLSIPSLMEFTKYRLLFFFSIFSISISFFFYCIHCMWIKGLTLIEICYNRFVGDLNYSCLFINNVYFIEGVK